MIKEMIIYQLKPMYLYFSSNKNVSLQAVFMYIKGYANEGHNPYLKTTIAVSARNCITGLLAPVGGVYKVSGLIT